MLMKPATVDKLSSLLEQQFDQGAHSVTTMIQSMLRSTRDRLGMEVAFVSEFSGGRRIFRYVDKDDTMDIIEVGDSDPLDETYCKWVTEGRLPELIPDAQAMTLTQEFESTHKIPIGAHVSVPIRLPDGRVYGTFCTFSTRAHESLTSRDLAFIRVFCDITSALLSENMDSLGDAKEARLNIQSILDQDHLYMVAQPIVSMADNQPIGYELWARVGGPYSYRPDILFETAARVGLTDELTLRTIELTKGMFDQVPEHCYLALNLAPEFLVRHDLLALFEGAPLNRLVLEITEHVLVKDYDAIISQLKPLHEAGVRLSVDDAGAGYASLRHILQLSPDIIKLDMSLIRNIDTDKNRQALTSALIAFSESRGYDLIAEGIETQSERDILIELGVSLGQGYFWSRPQRLESPLHS